MNGAESLVTTLVSGGVNVCFANPGTSEMHFVAALDRVDGMRCVLGLFEGVVTGAADMLDFPQRHVAHFVIRRVKKMVPRYSLPDAQGFRKVLRAGAAAAFTPVKVANTDIAFLQYTGGTTGVSKGAILAHRNIIANLKQTRAWSAPRLDLGEELIVVTAIPLYHIYALTNCALLSKVVMPALGEAEHAFSAALARINVEDLAHSAAALTPRAFSVAHG